VPHAHYHKNIKNCFLILSAHIFSTGSIASKDKQDESTCTYAFTSFKRAV